MKLKPSENPATPGKAWLWKTALFAALLGCGSWLFLHFLVPIKLPEDFPKPPELKERNSALAKLMGSADAQARAHPYSADEIGRLGMAYHANQFFIQAEAAYKIAARLAPDDYRWIYCRALLQEEEGREKEVFDLLLHAVRLKEDYIPALQKLADIYYKQNKLDEAARCLQMSLAAPGGSSSLQAAFGLGRVAARRKDWKKVIEYAEPLARAYPHVRSPHQLLLEAYEALGEAEKAAAERETLLQPDLIVVPLVKDPLYEELLTLTCSSTRLLKEAGLRSRFRKPDEAIRVARRAVEVAPDDADARHFLARTLLDAHGDSPESVSEALTHLREGLRLRPDDLLPLLYFGAMFFRQEKPDAAVEQIREMLAAHPESTEAHYYLGVIAERQGRPGEAMNHYQEALRKDPNYAEPCHKLGLLCVTEGKLDQAITYFQRAVSLKPTFVLARFNLGVALEQRGKTGQAITQFDEALRLKPNDAVMRKYLAMALLKTGKIPEAVQHSREAIRLTPGDAEGHYLLGCALALQRKASEAAEEFRLALKLQPDFADAANQLQKLEGKRE